ncbi:hypothetical protein [Ornithinimicrobium tianjinense]|uniref:Uncharacterized protein n=1 Tax=Ornithinimicrobium tianjinense TaxID=1195761 RepID=A0A917F4Z6_9MICO|nr:hypothetical protein [Ornithinimicrobium tianjinense]GGF52961.1 hypothetical protein GCM10011366_20900 [Ornithinimicrobium tianjinense]
MGRHRALDAAPRPGSRRSGSRHSTAAQRPWVHRVTGLPWMMLVLLGLVVVVSVSLLRPDTYAATATLTASSPRAASSGAVALSGRYLPHHVEEALELDPRRRGEIRVDVDNVDGSELAVTAFAHDPRLAALAADTASALVIREHPQDLSLQTPATVPSAPVSGQPLRWWALAAGLLGLAALLELTHERWEVRHTQLRPAGGLR